MTTSSNVTPVNLTDYAKRAYLTYAMSVVKSRALPDVRDGQKPVQRRILYAMDNLDLLNKPPTKSARVVGDVLGKYHPHGDSSVYDAMVRMQQSFSLRYPLVHGEGNFGSRDGDGAAAMRYTESKLAPIAQALLGELKWDTVDYQKNYDGKEDEPTTLPARLPFLLLNGASGIAVGLATEFLPHNLGEVVEGAKLLINKPKSTLDDLMEKIPGPDFPTGGQLITPVSELRRIYAEGRGSVHVRARYTVEQDGKDWKLVFFELPQPTAVEKVMIEIEELLNPTPKESKGKKLPLDATQLLRKQLFNNLIDTVDNHSDANIRLVVTPKNRKQDPEQLAMVLFAHTSLESSVASNFVAIDDQAKPGNDTILAWMGQWCNFRIETVRRRTTDEKKRIDKRLHIIAGRLTILDKIKEVIDLLQTAENPREALMDKYGLDEEQANDVLDMRLRQLARLEKHSLEDERARLQPESDRLGAILASESALRKLVIKELDQDSKLYGDARRTLLQPAALADAKAMTQEMSQDKASSETMAVVLSDRGWIAWKTAKNLAEVKPEDFKLKAGDTIRRTYFGNRGDTLMLMDEQGRGYSLGLSQLSGKSDSAPLTTWFDLGAKVIEGGLGQPADRFVLAGKGGYGFIVEGKDWIGRVKAGKALLTLGPDETPLEPVMLPAVKEGEEPTALVVAALASDGRMVTFPLADIKPLPKGKGVGLMGGINAKASLVDLTLVRDDGSVVLKGAAKSATLASKDLAKVYGARDSGRKGKVLSTLDTWLGFERQPVVAPVPVAENSSPS